MVVAKAFLMRTSERPQKEWRNWLVGMHEIPCLPADYSLADLSSNVDCVYICIDSSLQNHRLEYPLKSRNRHTTLDYC